MCERCQKILVGYAIPHIPEECPLLNVAYCPICAKRGHYQSQCPDSDALNSRQPQYLEQLIPHSVRSQYGIHSCTPLSTSYNPDPNQSDGARWYPQSHEPAWYVRLNDVEEIKRKLAEYNQTIYSDKDQNVAKLEILARSKGRRLVWTKNSIDLVEEHEKQEAIKKAAAVKKAAATEKKKHPKVSAKVLQQA